jgi:hypothetical protein
MPADFFESYLSTAFQILLQGGIGSSKLLLSSFTVREIILTSEDVSQKKFREIERAVSAVSHTNDTILNCRKFRLNSNKQILKKLAVILLTDKLCTLEPWPLFLAHFAQ